jgi:DNA invertase Pin-like site-specific DNA recombinase
MPRVYGYARVSTDRQVRSGLSLQHQEEVIKAHYERCFKETHEFAGVLPETKGVSAFKLPFHKRPVGAQIFKQLSKGDILLVDKPDRLFRSCRDCENTLHWLEKCGATLCIIDFMGATIDQQTWMGRHMLRNMISFAELESYLKSRRAMDTHAVKRAQGKGHGGMKYLCDNTPEGTAYMPSATIALAKHAWDLRSRGMSIPAVKEALEVEYCANHSLPYRKSAFHKYHYNVENTRTLMWYGNLLAKGVHPDSIAVMTMKALKEASVNI